jgi:dihydrodipicolinate synthase/N-acetylneuraminate lyase
MNIKKKYQGVVVPAITPLNADHSLDQGAVEKILALFHQHKVMPFILGTTGEAPSLPFKVKQEYIRQAARLKQPGDILYAGISSNCLYDSVELARLSFDEGVDVVVATLPSYYALSEVQMKKYFEQLAEKIPGPVIIYNIPATTHLSIPLHVIDELSHHPGIVGTKDSERNEVRLRASLELWAGRKDFSHFLGWAAKSGEALLKGGDGLVPSTANFAPGLYRDMEAAAQEGDQEKVARLQEQSDLLGNSYQSGHSLGGSLAALKLLMEKEGLCQHHMMPPL